MTVRLSGGMLNWLKSWMTAGCSDRLISRLR